jgi:thiol-disulfide isomerase/thioredoxin
MIILTFLQVILFILVIIVIFKLFFQTEIYNEIINSITTTKKANQQATQQATQQPTQAEINLKPELIKARIDANNKINRVIEESFISVMNSQNKINDGYIVSYLNKTNKIKLELYYKTSCKYCNQFMPVWNRIINDLPNDALYEEIDIEKDSEKVNENKITSVPTLILLVDNEKKFYNGDRTYNDINKFLKINGVNLIQRTFEDFSTVPKNNNLNPHCPSVTFDKQIDLENDSYMYQIFNSHGQYGYAVGGHNLDKKLTPFQAAYSTLDSYLSSLPDNTNTTTNSLKNIDECTNLNASQIINFGLCDLEQLNAIQGYKSNVASGFNKPLIDNTDYTNNEVIINSIKKVCGFTS